MVREGVNEASSAVNSREVEHVLGLPQWIEHLAPIRKIDHEYAVVGQRRDSSTQHSGLYSSASSNRCSGGLGSRKTPRRARPFKRSRATRRQKAVLATR